MRIKQTTLTVTEPEKKQRYCVIFEFRMDQFTQYYVVILCSYWRQKTKTAQWSQICAGVICVVGFLLIFSFTLSIAIESNSPNLRQYVTRMSHRTFPDKQPKCKIESVTERLIVCKKIDIYDDVSAEVEKLYEVVIEKLFEQYNAK